MNYRRVAIVCGLMSGVAIGAGAIVSACVWTGYSLIAVGLEVKDVLETRRINRVIARINADRIASE